MADKLKGISYITPRGVFVFPKLNKPDTKWKAEGQYSVKLRLKPDAVPADIVDKVNALRDAFAEQTKAELVEAKKGAKAKTLKVRDSFLADETDKDSGDATGFVILHAKMTASGKSKKDGKEWTRAPKLFDAKGTKLAPSKAIWGGTEGKLAVTFVPYYTPKDNEVGITVRLEAVQVLKLVSGSDRDAGSFGFGEEEGYTDDDAATGQSFNDESADADASGDAAQSGDDF